MFIGSTDAEAPILWAPEELTHWKKLLCWERLRAGREGGDRGWDGWIASLTQWAWVWANSERQWQTRKPGTLMFMRSWRVRHNLVNEQWSISSFIYNGITWVGEGTVLKANFPSLRRKSLPKKKKNDIDKMTLSVVHKRTGLSKNICLISFVQGT